VFENSVRFVEREFEWSKKSEETGRWCVFYRLFEWIIFVRPGRLVFVQTHASSPRGLLKISISHVVRLRFLCIRKKFGEDASVLPVVHTHSCAQHRREK